MKRKLFNRTDVTHFREMKSILDRWRELVSELARKWDGDDVPWWYRERTAVGLFAGAIWKYFRKGFALEEYTTDKKKSGGRRQGRGDIWFSLDGEKEFVAEAKLIEPRLNFRKPLCEKLKKLLKSARSDSKESSRYGTKAQRVGMMFVAPYSKSRPTSESIARFIEELEKVSKSAARAWTFPEFSLESNCKEKGKIYYCPGIALLIKPVRHQNRKNS